LYPHHQGERKYLVIVSLTWIILFFLVDLATQGTMLL
jgi:hypothetical protein